VNTPLEDMIESAENKLSTLVARLAVAEFQSDRENLRGRLDFQTGVISGLRQARFLELSL
jgi:hypothetical protein